MVCLRTQDDMSKKSKERKRLLLQEKVRRKAAGDFRYFIERWGWIEDKQTDSAIPFKLWSAQVGILPKFLSSQILIVLKARQLGLTWMTAAYCLWLAVFKPLQLIVVISAKEDWAVEFLDRVKFMKDRLPEWMIPSVDKETGQTLAFMHPNNEVSEIKSLATTMEGAQSKTPNLLVLDETARNRYVKSIYASSKPGIDKAKGRVIIISNSHKDGPGWGWTKGMYLGSMKGWNNLDRIFMPWWDCPERPTNFKELQLRGGMDDDDFSENYPETEQEAVSSALGSFFGKTLLRHNDTMPGVRGRIELNRFNKYEFIKDKNAVIELWRYPYHLVAGFDELYYTNRYCIGSDISEGLGQSYSVAYVMDRLTREFVAKISSNRIDATIWAAMLYDLSQYYGNAIICPERTGAGQTTVEQLAKKNANMVLNVIPDKVGSGITKKFGWEETHQNKHTLAGKLKEWFRTMDGIIFDAVLLDEAACFIRMENGVLDHEGGKESDHVIAGGCTIIADDFLGAPPEPIIKEHDGWLNRWQEG